MDIRLKFQLLLKDFYDRSTKIPYNAPGIALGGLPKLRVGTRPQHSQEFQSGTGRDPGIFQDGINLRFSSWDLWDPGIFWDRISLSFSSRDFSNKKLVKKKL